METLDQVITAALADEADYAPPADELLARLFDPAHVPARRAAGTARTWLVPAGLAAAIAMIVSGGVWWASHQTGVQPSKAPQPAPTAPSVTTAPPQAGSHQGRLPGYLYLSAGSVHVELETDQSSQDWWKNWTIDCPESVLAHMEIGDVACAGRDGQLPLWEVAASSGDGALPHESETIRWTSDVEEDSYAAEGGEVAIGGHPSSTQTVAVKVRYDCGVGCERWVDRTIMVVSFPDYHRQVTLVGRGFGDVDYLSNYIYLDPDS